MSDNVVIPQSGGGDNVGNFSSSVANTSAVTASATGPTSNGVASIAHSNDSSAIYGAHTDAGIGVFGRGGPNGGEGVFGQTTSNSSAVYGKNTSGPGVTGESAQGYGIVGTGSIGVFGQGTNSYGVIGHGGDVGVYAHNTTLSGNLNDAYLAARGFAGDFHGNVNVLGNVTVSGDVVLTGADCAEEFDIAQAAEADPGTVMVLGQDGILQQCQQAYDKRVAGVISGAGDYRPGMILDRQQSQDNRSPVALVGKVYCKVDAQYAPIKVGDLLTTSSTPGHAMKADDHSRAFGSVIGKALRPLEAGQELIPILIALQ